jgi:hypothetical protein
MPTRGPATYYKKLGGLDFVSLQTFLACDDNEADLLAFGQGLETVTLDCTEVHEDIGAVVAADETKTLGVVKPLNGAELTI